ncbi:lytic murein transglycosylase [Mesorhizobium sp. M7A.F.Ca.US.008.03.1.1]|nr:lytic murein transglycosylase [Mesorhizobium sp. M7A.F.Ca.US.008.03.1.1]
MEMFSRATPLWPAGHLPLKGGDGMLHLLSPISSVEEKAPGVKLPISPLEGEMSGRTEGGALAHSDQAKPRNAP